VEGDNLKDIITFRNLGIYLMMGIGCQFFVSGALALIRPLFETLFSYYDETISSIFVADTIIVAVYVIILAPIIEELMLRGILFNRLRYGISFTMANLLQAAVFGIYHWDIIQGLYAFLIGLLLGYIYERTRTLLAPIIVHIFINGSGFLLQILELGQYIPFWLAIIAGGGLLFAAINLFTKSTNHIKNV
jgi:membrane protease YdiL (CAAX protease family)